MPGSVDDVIIMNKHTRMNSTIVKIHNVELSFHSSGITMAQKAV